MKHKNIRRIDSKGTHGWQFHARRDGNNFSKMFSDNHFVGPDGALKVAQAHRTKFMLEYGPALNMFQETNRGNTTGVVGVSWYRDYYGELIGIQATVRIALNVTKNKKFRWEGRTQQETIEAAAEWRNNLLAQRAA